MKYSHSEVKLDRNPMVSFRKKIQKKKEISQKSQKISSSTQKVNYGTRLHPLRVYESRNFERSLDDCNEVCLTKSKEDAKSFEFQTTSQVVPRGKHEMWSLLLSRLTIESIWIKIRWSESSHWLFRKTTLKKDARKKISNYQEQVKICNEKMKRVT